MALTPSSTRGGGPPGRRRPGRTAPIAALVVFAVLLTACGPERVYQYRIMTRGPVSTNVEQFAGQVQRGLNDRRGWSLGGAIEFRRTNGPADFTVWLSTAGSVPSFSSMCSTQWSCRVGPNVIINEDRWRGATATWPYGVATYRNYVVNHEVGHWLGWGHIPCAGPGRRAPVMAQQSKGGAALGRCRFNVWPTEYERQVTAARHGVTARSIGLPSSDDPAGHLDRVDVRRRADGRPERVRLVGWAADGDTRGAIPIAVLVDTEPVWMARADKPRPDVQRIYPGLSRNHGFDVSVDVPPGAGVVCVDAAGVGSGLPRTQIGCEVVK